MTYNERLTRRVSLAFMPVLVLSIGAHADVLDDIKKHCFDKWSTDYEMQQYCIDNQVQSANAVIKEYNNLPASAEEKNIYSRCLYKWQSQRLDTIGKWLNTAQTTRSEHIEDFNRRCKG